MRVFKIVLIFLFILPLEAQESFIKLKDTTKLFITESGKGETLLFIPGWKMTHRFFEHQLSHFSKNYHVITYDPRGQGRSDKTETKNNYASHAKDLYEIIKKKNLKNITLIGWSSGCLTMYEYLRAFGNENISKLVFIDEPPKWIGDPKKEWVYGTFDDYRSSLKDMISKPSNPNGIINWMLKDSVSPKTKMWMRKEMLKTPDTIGLKLYLDGITCDYTKEVKGIDTPVLFMVRENWYNYAKKWIEKNVSGAKTVAITSHAMFWEKPTQFNSLLTKFLN